jgi:hypothetical protein
MLGVGKQSLRSATVGIEMALDRLFLDILRATHDDHDAASFPFVGPCNSLLLLLDFSGL